MNDIAKSRIVVLKKTLTGPLQIKTILLYKSRHHPLESTEDNSGERLYVLDREGTGGEDRWGLQPKEHSPRSGGSIMRGDASVHELGISLKWKESLTKDFEKTK